MRVTSRPGAGGHGHRVPVGVDPAVGRRRRGRARATGRRASSRAARAVRRALARRRGRPRAGRASTARVAYAAAPTPRPPPASVSAAISPTHSARSVGSLDRKPRSRPCSASIPNSASAAAAGTSTGAATLRRAGEARARRVTASAANPAVPRGAERETRLAEVVPRACVARDEQAIRRALQAPLSARVEDHRRGHAQHTDARREGAREDDGGRPAQPTLVGPAQRRRGQQRRPGGVQQQTGRERRAGRWGGPFLQRPGERRHDEQRREARAGRTSGRHVRARRRAAAHRRRARPRAPWLSRRRARAAVAAHDRHRRCAEREYSADARTAHTGSDRLTSACSERTQRSSQVTGGRSAIGRSARSRVPAPGGLWICSVRPAPGRGRSVRADRSREWHLRRRARRRRRAPPAARRWP